MRMMSWVLVLAFLSGCGEVPSDPPASCEDDMDCRNGYHCNLFFRMCEADEYDAGIPMEDGSIPSDDAQVPLDDGGNPILPDASEPDASSPGSDYWIRSDHGVIESEHVLISETFTVEMWLRFDSIADGDVILNVVNERFVVDIVDSCPGGGACGLQLSCGFQDFFGETHRLFASAESVSSGWHHISCTRHSDMTAEMHVDGVVVSQHDSMPLVLPTESYPMMAGMFDGDMDNLRISTPMRTRDSFVPEARTALLSSDRHYWPMNEGSGTVIEDMVRGVDFQLLAGSSWAP